MALVAACAATAVVAFVGASPAAAAGLSCPGGSYNLCIQAQGANEGVTGTPGSVVVAGYDFKVPDSGTTTVTVRNAYEQLTISCANKTTPSVSSIMVPMPTATYTAPFQQSNGWVPSGDQSSSLTYEGSFTLGDYCSGGTIDVGQPGQMLFAAQVQSNGTSQLSFRSHYNDAALSKSGSWSGTANVTPSPSGQTQTIAGHIYLCSNGNKTTTEVSGGTLGATGPQTVATQPNPLGPVSVAAGAYTMTETNPPGYQLASSCGTTSNTQTVTVPSGGAGVGIFYVVPTTCQNGPGNRQQSSAYQSGTPSISTTLGNTPSAGDLLIAEVQEAEGSGTTTSVTDGGLTFVKRENVTVQNADATNVTIWTATVPCGAAVGKTVTATSSSSNADMGIAVLEYPGLSGVIDGFGSSSGFTTGGTSTTVNSGAGAIAHAGDVVLGFEADSGWSVNLAADTADGYTSQVNVSNNQVAEFLDEDQVAASAGTYDAKATITYTGATAGELAAFGFPGVPYVMGTIAFAHS